MIQHPVRYPLTVIADRYGDAIQVLLNLYLSLAGFRMEMDICKACLHDAEDRKFGFFRESAQFMTYLHFHMQAVALVDSAHIPLDCGIQSAFIEHGWVEQVGKGSDLI